MPDSPTLKHPRSILVVGSGGREHTLVRAALASPGVERVIAAPGNGGMARDVACHPVQAGDIDGLAALASREKIDFVVVGPEVPLTLGLVDRLGAAGIAAYGPCAAGARLEGSKIFTKQLLLKHGIPTAPARAFTDAASALGHLRNRPLPVVIKADGLAAGKGVIIADTAAEAEAAVRSMLEQDAFGGAGRSLLIEDCLQGEETSIHLVVSGRDFVVLPTSQDHKRIGEGDTGPNTGGMGAYSPADLVSPALLDRIVSEVARPSVNAIADEGIDFRGTLYIGIMLVPDGPRGLAPKVLEFNTRFGDPETQVLIPRLATDPVRLMWAAAHGRLAGVPLEVKPDYALCVVLAAAGYPGAFPKGDTISLPPDVPESCAIYHAGTAVKDGAVVTSGGRVLGVTALAPTLPEAASRAYALCDRIQFRTRYFRRDIGARQLNRR